MQLTYQKLKPFALSYLTAPLAVFFAGYLRAPFAVVGLAVLAFAWWYAVCKTPQVKQVGQEEQGITLSVPKLVLLFALMLLWGYLGGQTGFFYQNSDWGYRNAIYRDLITNSWPVYYPQKDTALVYYIGHWLVPAALTKPVYALFGLDAAWMFARMALWGWTALGTYLAALNLLVYLRADTGKKQGIGLLFLIFFSGMDILGALYSSRLPDLLAYDAMHLEWWTNDFQFSSLTTCLFWVFNQTVGAPVDHAVAAVDQPLVVQTDKDLLDGVGAALVHREALTLPVAGAAQLFQLADNAAAISVFPCPGALQKAIAAQHFFGQALLAHGGNHLGFGGNGSMVGARHPQSGIALHALVAGQDILPGFVHGVAHVQLAGNIRRRHYDGERLFAAVDLGVEIALIAPFLVNSILCAFGIILLGEFFCHDGPP